MMADQRLGLAQVGDDPIEGVDADRLDRGAFASRSADLIQAVAATSPSLVAGLIGPWGSGKTSALTMIAEQLRKADKNWSIVEFNPWELNDLGSLIEEFLTTLREAIGEDKKAREAISKYARKIAPLAGLVPVLGGAGKTIIEVAGEQILGDTSLATQRKELVDALADTNRKILVMIDDVDRLQRDELATVLKLVRLVGRLPNISYLLAYDELTLLDILGSTDVGGGSGRRALAYLDKIVQLRLDLPPVSTFRIRRLVDRGISDVAAAHGVTYTEAEASRLRTVYFDCLEPSLTEPRHIKRFFGQVDALYALVTNEVDYVDFLLITFIRVFFPSVHREVIRAKGALTGTEFTLEKKSDADRHGEWTEMLLAQHGLDARTAERVMGVLSAMFRRLSKYSSGSAPERGIGKAEYFDRYIYLAIPPDDFSDAAVLAAVEEVAAGTPGDAASRLLASLENASEPITEKLARLEPPDGASARALIPFAVEVAAAIPDSAGLLHSARRRAHHYVTVLLNSAAITGDGDATVVVAQMLEHLSLNEVAAIVADTNAEADEYRDGPRRTSVLGDVVGRHLKADLEGQAAQSPELLGTGLTWTLTQWEHFGRLQPDEVREWMRSQVESGSWPVEDVVALFVSVAIYENGSRSLNGFDLHAADARLGIDWLLERFTPERQEGRFDRFGESKDTSFAERRRWAHHALALEAERRNSAGAPD